MPSTRPRAAARARACVHVCLCACACVYVSRCACACEHVSMCACVSACLRVCVSAHVCVCVCVHACLLDVRGNMFMWKHAHVQARTTRFQAVPYGSGWRRPASSAAARSGPCESSRRRCKAHPPTRGQTQRCRRRRRRRRRPPRRRPHPRRRHHRPAPLVPCAALLRAVVGQRSGPAPGAARRDGR